MIQRIFPNGFQPGFVLDCFIIPQNGHFFLHPPITLILCTFQNSGILRTSPKGNLSESSPLSGTAHRVGIGQSSGKSP